MMMIIIKYTFGPVPHLSGHNFSCISQWKCSQSSGLLQFSNFHFCLFQVVFSWSLCDISDSTGPIWTKIGEMMRLATVLWHLQNDTEGPRGGLTLHSSYTVSLDHQSNLTELGWVLLFATVFLNLQSYTDWPYRGCYTYRSKLIHLTSHISHTVSTIDMKFGAHNQ